VRIDKRAAGSLSSIIQERRTASVTAKQDKRNISWTIYVVGSTGP
jgi:hypothetical protein